MYPRVLVLEPSGRPDVMFQLFVALIAILGFIADGGSAERAIHRRTSRTSTSPGP